MKKIASDPNLPEWAKDFPPYLQGKVLAYADHSYKQGLLRAAEIALTTVFSRICNDHEFDCPEIKYNFHGCKEISDAILKESDTHER